MYVYIYVYSGGAAGKGSSELPNQQGGVEHADGDLLVQAPPQDAEEGEMEETQVTSLEFVGNNQKHRLSPRKLELYSFVEAQVAGKFRFEEVEATADEEWGNADHWNMDVNPSTYSPSDSSSFSQTI